MGWLLAWPSQMGELVLALRPITSRRGKANAATMMRWLHPAQLHHAGGEGNTQGMTAAR
jgi:hypothetical protein